MVGGGGDRSSHREHRHPRQRGHRYPLCPSAVASRHLIALGSRSPRYPASRDLHVGSPIRWKTSSERRSIFGSMFLVTNTSRERLSSDGHTSRCSGGWMTCCTPLITTGPTSRTSTS